MPKAKKKTATKKKAAGTRKKAKSKNLEMLLVASKTKEALKAHDVNVSADALEGLNKWTYWLIEQAVSRAVANGRKTVRAHDFIA